MGKIVVIGLGNILCGDDAFGVFLAEKLYELYDFPPNVEIIDGGAQGPALFRYIERAERMLVFDAVDFGLPPSTIVRREYGELPLWIGAKKLTAHQNSFAELLALADLKNVTPSEIVLIGAQIENTEFGTVLGDALNAKIPEALELALRCLANWGVIPAKASSVKTIIQNELLESDFYRK